MAGKTHKKLLRAFKKSGKRLTIKKNSIHSNMVRSLRRVVRKNPK